MHRIPNLLNSPTVALQSSFVLNSWQLRDSIPSGFSFLWVVSTITLLATLNVAGSWTRLPNYHLLQLGCGLSGVLLVQYPDPHPFSRLFCGFLSAPQKNGTLNYRRFAGCSGLPLPDTPHTRTHSLFYGRARTTRSDSAFLCALEEVRNRFPGVLVRTENQGVEFDPLRILALSGISRSLALPFLTFFFLLFKGAFEVINWQPLPKQELISMKYISL